MAGMNYFLNHPTFQHKLNYGIPESFILDYIE